MKLANLTVLSLDVMDISGETQRDISHNILKTRLTDVGVPVPDSVSGELRNELDKLNEQKAKDYCGSCYGGTPPEGGCCNTCDQVRQAYVDKGWSFGNPDAIEQVSSEIRVPWELATNVFQCVDEGWSDKLKEQSDEGCNISGRLRVNKVIGNIHFSPGRSFQSSSRNIYELVPYLRNDGNRHDFSHIIHQFAFMGDDEYDLRKAKYGNEMKRRLGLDSNPLDGTVARVSICRSLSAGNLHRWNYYRHPKLSICSNTS